MKRSLMTFGLFALCASGMVVAGPTAADIERAAKSNPTKPVVWPTTEKFSVTFTNNSNDDVFLVGYYQIRGSGPARPLKDGISVPAHSKNLLIYLEPNPYDPGSSVADIQKVTVYLGQTILKTVTNGGSVTVEQKDADNYKRIG